MVSPGIGWLCVMLGAAIGLAAAFGFFGHRPPPPNIYQCRRCGHRFHGSPDRPYPARCPACGSTGWAVGA